MTSAHSPFEAAGCVGKTAFASHALAERVRRLRSRRRKHDGGEPSVSPYRCEYCGQWHLGSQTGRRP